MTDDAARSKLLSFMGTAPGQLVQGERLPGASQTIYPVSTAWTNLWLVVAAHAVELRRAGVIDDEGFSRIARSLIAARQSNDAEGSSAMILVNDLDERVESQIPASVSGAATLGLAREEWLATAARLIWRVAALRILDRTLLVSE